MQNPSASSRPERVGPTALGPVMLDLSDASIDSLAAADRERLLHPLVGGVIHFARHYRSPEQIRALNAEIHALREPALLIAVDHEGGRVQRFRDGFTVIPPMRTLGDAWDTDPAAACAEARRLGRLMADELTAHGIDFSFAPVLDLDHGRCAAIGDRAFHRDPGATSELAIALITGMKDGAMASVGKHFPGHGYVVADSHHEMPVDERSLHQIASEDLVPFSETIQAGLDGVMPAHVLYPAVDAQPAGFSRRWLQDILRGQLQFDGAIFSDDLGMAGAHAAGDMVARADAAFSAGCDIVLVCNDLAAADDLLARWRHPGEGRDPSSSNARHPGEGRRHPGEGRRHPGEGRDPSFSNARHPGEGRRHPGEGRRHPGEGRDPSPSNHEPLPDLARRTDRLRFVAR